jgi:dTDP-4-dehydrorhamnose reductase
MTRYLIAGGGGMLGTDLAVALAGKDVTNLTRAQLDVTDIESVHEAVAGHDVILNAAAYTNVDGAETNEAAARLINATGAANLAIAAAANGAILVQVSTDYVFDGSGSAPYPEPTDPAPVSAYGRTKAEGEVLVQRLNPARSYVVRTAWLYGANGSNFARTMVRLGSTQEEVEVVVDQVGQPTWSLDVANQIVALLDSRAPAGIYHATNSGQASWFDFAREIFRQVGWDPERVRPTTAARFARPAPRPNYSVLGHDAWGAVGLAPMRDWRDALSAAYGAGVLAPAL